VRHETWVAERDDVVWAEHGIAALAGTFWLDGTARAFDGLPGEWRTDGGGAVGEIDGRMLRLHPGDEQLDGDLLLRGFARDGVVAVRVFDPAASTRRGISHIERFSYDPALRVAGRFTPAEDEESSESVDGHRCERVYDGVVDVDSLGIRITVDKLDDGTLFATIADATAGTESYRFRHLRLPTPDSDGTVAVDFNLLALPPCAFSDHYVCVFPPVGNRLDIPLRGGEAVVA
jgi:uncharacterized protein (DUF1684 family)